MKKSFKLLVVFFVCVFAFSFFLCAPTADVEDTVATASIFEIPASITGNSGSTLAISQDAKTSINIFFKVARDQIYTANEWGQIVKNYIVKIEEFKLFGLEEGLTHVTADGDKVKWTPEADGKYLLEYWKKDGETFKKFVEMQFTKYNKTADGLDIAGNVIIDTTLVDETEPTGVIFPKWVKITFDSNKEEKKYMKIEVDDFQAYGVTLGTDLQECILEAWKDADGNVEVVGVTSAPIVTTLNYGYAAEKRYYIYSGKGTTEKATMSLAMPLAGYLPANIFDDAPSTVGGIIQEYFADQLRADHEYSETLSGYDILDYLVLGYDASTADIYTKIKDTYENGDDTVKAYLEYIYTVMSVSNPVYFSDSSCDGFYSTNVDFAPADGVDAYPGVTDLPEFSVTEAEVDDLLIEFAGDLQPGS